MILFYIKVVFVVYGQEERMKFVHNTTKAWENAYVVEFGPYTWNDCEQRKRKRWLRDLVLSPC